MRKAVLLISFLLIICLLTSCGDGITTETLEQSLLDALNGSSDVFGNENDPEFVSYIENTSNFKVLSFSQNDDLVTAEIEVKSPDLFAAVNNVTNSSTIEDEVEANNVLIEEMKKLPIIESHVQLEFEITNNDIKAILSDEFLDAYYGGVFRLRNETIESYLESGGN